MRVLLTISLLSALVPAQTRPPLPAMPAWPPSIPCQLCPDFCFNLIEWIELRGPELSASLDGYLQLGHITGNAKYAIPTSNFYAFDVNPLEPNGDGSNTFGLVTFLLTHQNGCGLCPASHQMRVTTQIQTACNISSANPSFSYNLRWSMKIDFTEPLDDADNVLTVRESSQATADQPTGEWSNNPVGVSVGGALTPHPIVGLPQRRVYPVTDTPHRDAATLMGVQWTLSGSISVETIADGWLITPFFDRAEIGGDIYGSTYIVRWQTRCGCSSTCFLIPAQTPYGPLISNFSAGGGTTPPPLPPGVTPLPLPPGVTPPVNVAAEAGGAYKPVFGATTVPGRQASGGLGPDVGPIPGEFGR